MAQKARYRAIGRRCECKIKIDRVAVLNTNVYKIDIELNGKFIGCVSKQNFPNPSIYWFGFYDLKCLFFHYILILHW